MTLIRWKPKASFLDPLNGIAEIQDEVNRLFDSSLNRYGQWERSFSPALDLYEDKDNVHVKVELPGLSKGDVSVTVHDDILSIKGEKRQETEKKDANVYRIERSFGSFARTIELPSNVDSKRVEARFKDGVLQITLPKSESAKPKEIEVKVN